MCRGSEHRTSLLKPEETKEESKAVPRAVCSEGPKSVPKHKPLLNAAGEQSLVLSPSMNPESVHFHNVNEEDPAKPGAGMLTFCSCGQLCEAGHSHCDKCRLRVGSVQERAGYVYEMNKKTPGELNRYWFSMLGKDLYRICLCDMCRVQVED